MKAWLSRVDPWLGAAALFVVALALRLHHLDRESLFMDEPRQVSYYSDDLVRIVRDAASQQQPPLDYWIGAFVYRISQSDFAVRLPAALFGAGSILLFTLLARRAASWGAALCLGGVLTLLPFHLYYSQDARPYALPIFLLLALLLQLDRVLTTPKPRAYDLPALMLVGVLFLFSRTLFPAVITLTLGAALFGWTLSAGARGQPLASPAQRRRLGAMVALALAGLFYLPLFLRILAAGARYTNDESGIARIIAAGVHSFDPVPLLHAWLAMAEPLGWVLLPLVLVAPLLVLSLPELRERPVALLLALALPGAALLNLFVFQAKTDLPFRPAYAAYALPMGLVLCAVVLDLLWRRLQHAAGPRIGAPVAMALTLALWGYTARATMGFEAPPKHNTDWKGLSGYLGSHYGAQDALVFDSLCPSGAWEPDFYGFPRYYRGESRRVALSGVPDVGERLAVLPYRPVIILFQYHNYYLTRHSPYPVISTYKGHPALPLTRLLADPRLQVTAFTGLTVVTLKRPPRGFALDLLELLEILLPRLPQDSSLANLHVAAAALAQVCGVQRARTHLEAGLGLIAQETEKTEVRRAQAKLGRAPQGCLGGG